MQSNARLSAKYRDSEKPPTAWRTYSTSSVARDSSLSRQETQDRLSTATAFHTEGFDFRVSPVKRSAFHRRTSSELSVQQHATRDSMLDNILLSLNHMQDGEVSHSSKQPPLYSSFKDGEFKLDTPRFVYDAITHMSSNSQSSSVSSSPYLKQQDSFSPTEFPNTPTRQSSAGHKRNANALQSSPSRKTVSEHTELEHRLAKRSQNLEGSVPNTSNPGTPKSRRTGSNSMDLGRRNPRDATRRHKSTKSDASVQPSQLPANAIISQPPKPNTPKKSSIISPPEPPKERPGFLRRVFGSARTRSQVRQQQPDQPLPVSTGHETTSAKKSSDQLPTLNKKASFFRRKKRDAPENETNNYGASNGFGPGSPMSVPGLALTTDDHPIASSWGGNRLTGDEHAFEISYKQTYEPVLVKPAKRIWIQPEEFDRVVPAPIISTNPDVLIIEGAGALPAPMRSSALSQALQSMYNSSSAAPSQVMISSVDGLEDPYVDQPVHMDLTLHQDSLEDDRDIARRMYNGGEIDNSQTATLLGQQTQHGDRLRQAYMDLYDFAGRSLLSALRELCGRLALKAETQQVDRILAAFSQRWCQCNPNHDFRSQDVVHTICYSLFLLNTDLHMADHEHKMTKNQFIRNTLPTLRSIIDGHATTDIMIMKENAATTRPTSSSGLDLREGRPSLDRGYSDGRLSVRPKLRPASGISSFTNQISDTSVSLVNTNAENSMRAWENHIETILRDFYNSIRQQRLPLSGTFETQTNDQSSNPSLSIRSSSMQRTSSVTSRDLLETPRSRVPRWTRTKGKPYSSSTIATGRQSSEEQSIFNPTSSTTWGRTHGKTLTPKSTMSLDSQARPSTATQQHSIGFANALGQALVSSQDDQAGNEAVRLEDEILQLAGAPWAKEGIVQHKHQLQAMDKKSKDRHWIECFAVVEKGQMRLFSFTSKASVRSQRQKSSKGGIVGGGNWTESAESLEKFILMRTIAEVLPKGYSTSRPDAFTLTLPSGAVHVFQVGTPEISKEFVDTINYWSARYTPQPLSGGVSSIEYGWSDALLNSMPEPGLPRSSFQSSIRSGFEGTGSRGNTRARLPGDRVALADWTPPVAPIQPSTLPEGQQLAALMVYLEEVEREMQLHADLRAKIKNAYTPAQSNGMKAMANWEKKSTYLQGECTRLRKYIECLNAARLEEEKLRTRK